MELNPLDPRFGRCPSSATSSSSTSAAAAALPTPTTFPPRGSHRRAHSETFLRIPDDFLVDSDPDFSFDDIDFPSLSDDSNSAAAAAPASLQAAPPAQLQPAPKPEPAKANPRAGGGSHMRSLSVDAAMFDNLGFQAEQAGAGDGKVRRHRHSNSMDGSTSSFEMDSSSFGAGDLAKKAMAADKLAELALVDPKKAKRILANRQSAARSKERKIRYTSELERKVQTLQMEATSLSAQVTVLQRDTTSLTTENKELKLRLQAMEQQAHLREALNEALRDEVQRLKIATGQIPPVNGNAFNRGLPQQTSSFFGHPQQLHGLGMNQAQRPQTHHMTQPSSNNHQPSSHISDDSMDFM